MDAFSLLQHVVLIHHLHVGRKCRLHSSLFTLDFRSSLLTHSSLFTLDLRSSLLTLGNA